MNSHPEAFNQLDTFLLLVRDKNLQVVIDRTFPLAEARAAQLYLDVREHFGKVILTM